MTENTSTQEMKGILYQTRTHLETCGLHAYDQSASTRIPDMQAFVSSRQRAAEEMDGIALFPLPRGNRRSYSLGPTQGRLYNIYQQHMSLWFANGVNCDSHLLPALYEKASAPENGVQALRSSK